MRTGTHGRSARVVVRILIEWDLVGAMVIAEDVAAVPAVVAAGEVAEGLATGGMVADC
jgi:hypothetical protein